MTGSDGSPTSGSLAAKLVAMVLLAALVAVGLGLVLGTMAPPPGQAEARDHAPAFRSNTLHVVRPEGGGVALEEVVTVTARSPLPLAALSATLTLGTGGEALRWEGAAADGTLNLTVLRDRDRSASAEQPRLSEGDVLRLRADLSAWPAERLAAGGPLVRVLRAPGSADAVLEAPLPRVGGPVLPALPATPT